MNMAKVSEDHPSVISKKYKLSAQDRCDKCSAQALVMVKGLSGELSFCGHHYNSIMDNEEGYKKMMSFMLEIIDEREKMEYKKPIGGI